MGTRIDPRFTPKLPLAIPYKLPTHTLFYQDMEHLADLDWWGLYTHSGEAGSFFILAGELVLRGPDAPASNSNNFLWLPDVWVPPPVELELRLRHSGKDASHNFMWGLIDTPWNNDVMFRLDYPTDGNVNLEARSAGSVTYADSGVATDTDPHTYLIRWFSDRAEFYMDGSLLGTITTNVPSVCIRPFLCVWVKAGAPYGELRCDWINLRLG